MKIEFRDGMLCKARDNLNIVFEDDEKAKACMNELGRRYSNKDPMFKDKSVYDMLLIFLEEQKDNIETFAFNLDAEDEEESKEDTVCDGCGEWEFECECDEDY